MGSCYGNFHKASSTSARLNFSLENSRVRYKGICKSPTTSHWHGKFLLGLSAKMVQMCKSNLDLSVEILIGVVGAVRNELKDTKEKRRGSI